MGYGERGVQGEIGCVLAHLRWVVGDRWEMGLEIREVGWGVRKEVGRGSWAQSFQESLSKEWPLKS